MNRFQTDHVSRTGCIVIVFAILLSCALTSGAQAEDLTFTDTVLDFEQPMLSWITGKHGKILMSYGNFPADDKIRLAESTDAGKSWRVFTTLPYSAGYAYMTRLADDSLVMVVYNGWAYPTNSLRDLGWIRSTDEGRTWSEPTPIGVNVPSLYPWGPILEMPDGRWAYCPYSEKVDDEGVHLRTRCLLVWSEDRGRTWSDGIEFSTTADGNQGLTEGAVLQTGPHQFFAALRTDDTVDCWDGFYWSRSTDGLNWSVPESFGDVGREPLFYRIGDYWVLTYRQYVQEDGKQYSALRFSRDGVVWSDPVHIGEGVDSGACLVQVGDQLIAMNHEYPQRKKITRRVIDLKNLVQE